MNIYIIWKDQLTEPQFQALEACMSDGIVGRIGAGLYRIKSLQESFDLTSINPKHLRSVESFLNWVLSQGNTHIMTCY